ncbi:hypothetical protein JXB31_02895 [Candidatus Woesearchaeota archaeon]|nr:hypothetical protein [Candidatus Woesearchaeota archaeon]
MIPIIMVKNNTVKKPAEKKGPSQTIVRDIKGIELKYCRHCCSYLYKNNQLPAEKFIGVFDNLLLKHLDLSTMPETVEIDKKRLLEPEKRFTLSLTVSKVVHDKLIKERYDVPVRVIIGECQRCSRISGNYYEGVFQLRNKESADFLIVYKRIINETEKMRKKGISITKEARVRNGIDLYFTNSKFMQQLGARLYRSFGGEFKVNPSLYGRNRQTSKDIYRLNVLFRLPEFSPGDIISFENRIYSINSFSKDMIICTELISRKKLSIKNSEDIELIATPDKFRKAVVVRKKPYLEILHPDSYENIRPMNSPAKQDEKKGQIRVLVDGSRVYCVD